MTLRWRIYYDDGSTFSNLDGTEQEAPGVGILCIVQQDPTPRTHSVNTQVLEYSPVFWYHRGWGYWVGSDFMGMVDQFTHDPKGEKCALKLGRWAESVYYNDIREKAKNDPDFVKKSGTSNVERLHRDF